MRWNRVLKVIALFLDNINMKTNTKNIFVLSTPLLSLLVSCGSNLSYGSPVSNEEAADIWEGVTAFQESEEAEDFYQDIKVDIVGSLDDVTAGIYIYSPKNLYYCIKNENDFQGLYKIDGVDTLVTVRDGVETTSTKSEDLSSFAFGITLAVVLYLASMLDLVDMVVSPYQESSSSENENVPEATFMSKGEGNLTAQFTHYEVNYTITVDNNLLTRAHMTGIDDDGEQSEATLNYTYTTTEADREIRIPQNA